MYGYQSSLQAIDAHTAEIMTYLSITVTHSSNHRRS